MSEGRADERGRSRVPLRTSGRHERRVIKSGLGREKERRGRNKELKASEGKCVSSKKFRTPSQNKGRRTARVSSAGARKGREDKGRRRSHS